MKLPAFDYTRATSVGEALDLLDANPEARILAGGQSLLAALALRLSEPPLLVDIGRLAALRFIDEQGGVIRVGALARHRDLLESPLLAAKLPLVSQAMPFIAHAAIRNRGTIGGSLAHADPAAELPACMLALGATMVIAGRAGERRVAAADFFQGLYATAIAAGELLVRVEIPVPPAGTRAHFAEISRRRGDFAMAGLAAVRPLDSAVRLVYFGCADRPVRAPAAERALAGAASLAPDARRAALKSALATDLDPQTDLQASGAMRIHLAAVLAERALQPLGVA